MVDRSQEVPDSGTTLRAKRPSTRSEHPRPTGRPTPTALAARPRRCDKDPVLRGGDGLDADLIARLYAETAGW